MYQITILSYDEMVALRDHLDKAIESGQLIRFHQAALGRCQIKYKIGEGMWTPGIGTCACRS